MTIETPVSPNRCAEFLDARQRGEVKGRVEFQNGDGLWCETIDTADQFRRSPNPDTPRGYDRIVHEPAPVKVPWWEAVGRTLPDGGLIGSVGCNGEHPNGWVVAGTTYPALSADSDGMVEVLPDEPEPDAYSGIRAALAALLDGHKARGVPGSYFEVVDRRALHRDGGASLVLVDRLGCHYHTAQSLTDEARDGLVIADPPDEPRRVTVELDEDDADGAMRLLARMADVGSGSDRVATAIAHALDALRCSDTSDEREGNGR